MGKLSEIHTKRHNRIHTCLFCAKSFKSGSNLDDHTRRHIFEKPFSCDLCKNTFANRSDMLKHKNTHFTDTRAKNIVCSICDAKFRTKHQLTCHMKCHATDKKFKCDICEKTFTRNDCLQNHTSVHAEASETEKDRNTCIFCLKLFRRMPSLQRHLLVHINERPFECTHCDSSFATCGELLSHNGVHLTSRKIQCDICNKIFKSTGALRSHKKRIHGEKTTIYKCPYSNCPYTTLIEGDVKSHLKSHLGEKYFKCEVCNKEYRSSTALQLHRSEHFPDLRKKLSRNCPICAKPFRSTISLRVHLKLHSTGKIHQCEICEMRFATKCSLKSHMRTHTKEMLYKCRACKSEFLSRGARFTHEQYAHNIGNPLLKCEVCKITMRKTHLRHHILQNYAPKRHECVFCGLKYTRLYDLSAHIRKHIKEAAGWCGKCNVEITNNGYLLQHSRKCSKRLKPPRRKPAK